MWSFLLFVATISFIYGADNNYQDLGANLPIPLTELITAVYGDKLYAIGGFYTNQTKKSLDTIWNDKIYSLDLSGISLSGTDDITGNSGLSWTEVSVTAPTYGPASGTNKMACRGQCSAQIGKYLYIVGPYTVDESENTAQDTVYRLDLSTMTYAGSGDFKSTSGYETATVGQCVTAINGVLYTVGSNSNYGDFISYTPSPSDTQTSLTDFTGTNRFYSGCGAGEDNSKLWVLGGQGNPVYADDYDFDTTQWTIRSFNNPSGNGLFDNADSTSSSSRNRIRCVSSLYDAKIECIGGVKTTGQLTTAVRYSTTAYQTGTSENTYSDLLSGLSSAGVSSYQLLDNGDNAAELMLVVGGWEGSSGFVFPASAKVQYAVRYYTVPGPTPNPTKEPTVSPTTKTPTRDPICPTCTASPTESPTTAAPTPATESPTTAAPTDATMSPTAPTEAAGSGNGVAQLCMAISCVMAFLSVIII